MSKRELKKYIHDLNKEQLEEQIIDLYQRFKEVKTYYDFAFNPKEDKLCEECKLKISNEYFPTKRKRARARRSVAQNYIKHFITLGMESSLVADVMLYSIEIAQVYSGFSSPKQDAFYKSMLTSYEKAMDYICINQLQTDFKERLEKIADQASEQRWINAPAFEKLLLQNLSH